MSCFKSKQWSQRELLSLWRADASALFLACLLVPSVGAEDTILLRDVTRETGITFRHTDGSGGNRYIMETVCCGLALLDYDGDEKVDIYFLNGAPLKGSTTKSAPRNALYRNQGGWKITSGSPRGSFHRSDSGGEWPSPVHQERTRFCGPWGNRRDRLGLMSIVKRREVAFGTSTATKAT